MLMLIYSKNKFFKKKTMIVETGSGPLGKAGHLGPGPLSTASEFTPS